MKSKKDLEKIKVLLDQPILVNIEEKTYFINQMPCSQKEFYSIVQNNVVCISKGLHNSQWNVQINDNEGKFKYPVITKVHNATANKSTYFINEEIVDWSSFNQFSASHDVVRITISYLETNLVHSAVMIDLVKNEDLGTEFTDVAKPLEIDIKPLDLKKVQEACDALVGKYSDPYNEYVSKWASSPTAWVDEMIQPTAHVAPFEATADPIKNYQTLKESTNSMEIKLDDVSPSNRTLAIVYGSAQSPSDFRERATRLIGSLNMPDTIKVVVVTANGNKVFSGLDFTQPKLDGELDPAILDHVKKRFVQVLEVHNGGNI